MPPVSPTLQVMLDSLFAGEEAVSPPAGPANTSKLFSSSDVNLDASERLLSQMREALWQEKRQATKSRYRERQLLNAVRLRDAALASIRTTLWRELCAVKTQLRFAEEQGLVRVRGRAGEPSANEIDLRTNEVTDTLLDTLLGDARARFPELEDGEGEAERRQRQHIKQLLDGVIEQLTREKEQALEEANERALRERDKAEAEYGGRLQSMEARAEKAEAQAKAAESMMMSTEVGFWDRLRAAHAATGVQRDRVSELQEQQAAVAAAAAAETERACEAVEEAADREAEARREAADTSDHADLLREALTELEARYVIALEQSQAAEAARDAALQQAERAAENVRAQHRAQQEGQPSPRTYRLPLPSSAELHVELDAPVGPTDPSGVSFSPPEDDPPVTLRLEMGHYVAGRRVGGPVTALRRVPSPDDGACPAEAKLIGELRAAAEAAKVPHNFPGAAAAPEKVVPAPRAPCVSSLLGATAHMRAPSKFKRALSARKTAAGGAGSQRPPPAAPSKGSQPKWIVEGAMRVAADDAAQPGVDRAATDVFMSVTSLATSIMRRQSSRGGRTLGLGTEHASPRRSVSDRPRPSLFGSMTGRAPVKKSRSGSQPKRADIIAPPRRSSSRKKTPPQSQRNSVAGAVRAQRSNGSMGSFFCGPWHSSRLVESPRASNPSILFGANEHSSEGGQSDRQPVELPQELPRLPTIAEPKREPEASPVDASAMGGAAKAIATSGDAATSSKSSDGVESEGETSSAASVAAPQGSTPSVGTSTGQPMDEGSPRPGEGSGSHRPAKRSRSSPPKKSPTVSPGRSAASWRSPRSDAASPPLAAACGAFFPTPINAATLQNPAAYVPPMPAYVGDASSAGRSPGQGPLSVSPQSGPVWSPASGGSASPSPRAQTIGSIDVQIHGWHRDVGLQASSGGPPAAVRRQKPKQAAPTSPPGLASARRPRLGVRRQGELRGLRERCADDLPAAYWAAGAPRPATSVGADGPSAPPPARPHSAAPRSGAPPSTWAASWLLAAPPQASTAGCRGSPRWQDTVPSESVADWVQTAAPPASLPVPTRPSGTPPAPSVEAAVLQLRQLARSGTPSLGAPIALLEDLATREKARKSVTDFAAPTPPAAAGGVREGRARDGVALQDSGRRCRGQPTIPAGNCDLNVTMAPAEDRRPHSAASCRVVAGSRQLSAFVPPPPSRPAVTLWQHVALDVDTAAVQRSMSVQSFHGGAQPKCRQPQAPHNRTCAPRTQVSVRGLQARDLQARGHGFCAPQPPAADRPEVWRPGDSVLRAGLREPLAGGLQRVVAVGQPCVAGVSDLSPRNREALLTPDPAPHAGTPGLNLRVTDSPQHANPPPPLSPAGSTLPIEA